MLYNSMYIELENGQRNRTVAAFQKEGGVLTARQQQEGRGWGGHLSLSCAGTL